MGELLAFIPTWGWIVICVSSVLYGALWIAEKILSAKKKKLASASQKVGEEDGRSSN